MITYITGRAVVECPFCHEHYVTAFHKPSFKQGKVSRISNKSATRFSRVDEKYYIQGDCPKCGAKNKDIQDWYDGKGEKKEISHEERIRRLKESGLPTVITTEVKKD